MQTFLTVAALSSVVLIGWVDYVTGPEIGLSLFYLVPVVLAGWRIGHRSAIAVACAAALAWFLADFTLRPGEHAAISIWNGFTRLAMYNAIGLLLARVRRDGKLQEALLVRERELSRTDSLTGLRNARAFVEMLGEELERARREHHTLCIAYMDLDNFKRVNDLYGHVAGDELLKRIAEAIRLAIRSGSPKRAADLCARLGGDEFAVLFWNVKQEAIEGIGRRLVERIAELGKDFPAAGLGVSVGIAYFVEPPNDPEQMVRQADAAMYQAKTSGKGRIVVWTQTAAAA